MDKLILTDGQIEKLHKVGLEMLIEFDRICRKENIKYSIESGTLLGAVRDGRFIPWDDDVDVSMTRTEYNKFFAACDKYLDKSRFFLDCHETDPEYIFGYSKLRGLGTVFRQIGHETLTQRNEIFMDIIILDNIPDHHISRIIHSKICNIIKTILNAQLNIKSNNPIVRLRSKLLMLIPRNAFFPYYIHLRELITGKTLNYAECIHIPLQVEGGVPTKCYKKYRDIKFENHKFMCFDDYDSYLKYAYGNHYMELPPVEKIKPHINVSELSFGNIFGKEE